MKIGLLTYFRLDVAGQYFQALATLEHLAKSFPGATVELLNIVHEKQRGFRPSRQPRYFLPSIIRHFSYERARRQHLHPALSGPLLEDNGYASVEAFLQKQAHDLLVVGADTCLKIDRHYRAKDDIPFFWIAPSVKTPRIMLSGSAEYTDLSDLSTNQKAMAAASLGGFHFLGVRDRMTFELVESLRPDLSDRIEEMPDPTLPWSAVSHGLPSLDRLKARTGKKLCGMNLADTPFVRDLVRSLSAQYHFVSVTCPIQRGGSRIAPGPDDWLNMFGSFDLMLTSSFHETIFSLKAGIPVVAIDSSANRVHPRTGLSKTRCLLEAADLSAWHINPHRESSVPDAVALVATAAECFPHETARRSLSRLTEQYGSSLRKAVASVTP